MAGVAKEVWAFYPNLALGTGEALQMRIPAPPPGTPVFTPLQGLQGKALLPFPPSMGQSKFSGLGDTSTRV